jgi:hypothetical protein
MIAGVVAQIIEIEGVVGRAGVEDESAGGRIGGRCFKMLVHRVFGEAEKNQGALE